MKFAIMVTIVAKLSTAAGVKGIDVSNFQPNVNWNAVRANGINFAYIKATESVSFRSPDFNAQYVGATQTGLLRGAYHIAKPAMSSGAVQATFFLANGGGWVNDGRTLPGALDLEGDCSGLSPSAMVRWIQDFSNTYRATTTRKPVIYTTTSWWQRCTGNNDSFGNNPLWIARYGSSSGPLPKGWSTYTFWQYADQGPNPGAQDIFKGDLSGLKRFASG